MIGKIINERHSVRKYQKEEIPDEVVRKITYLASKAPSAGGLKSYTVFVAKGKDVKELAKLAHHQNWIANASLIFVICIDPQRSGKRYGNRGKELYCIQDATLHGAYLDLLFVSRGYGTCWVGAFDENKVREYLSLPNYLIPISFLVVGKKYVVK